MFWKNTRSPYGFVGDNGEKVQMYECQFTTTKVTAEQKGRHTANMRVLVVCDTVETAIAECRKRWPDDFVLHQIVKRNQGFDLIVSDSALPLSEKE